MQTSTRTATTTSSWTRRPTRSCGSRRRCSKARRGFLLPNTDVQINFYNERPDRRRVPAVGRADRGRDRPEHQELDRDQLLQAGDDGNRPGRSGAAVHRAGEKIKVNTDDGATSSARRSALSSRERPEIPLTREIGHRRRVAVEIRGATARGPAHPLRPHRVELRRSQPLEQPLRRLRGRCTPAPCRIRLRAPRARADDAAGPLAPSIDRSSLKMRPSKPSCSRRISLQPDWRESGRPRIDCG